MQNAVKEVEGRVMQIREYEGIVGKRVKDIIDKCVGVDVEDHTQGVGIQLGE